MKILIVDDEPVANFITIRLLKTLDADLDIIDHTKPLVAIKELQSINPDVIFLDLNMPEMSGWEFLNKMVKDKLQYRVYILTSSVSTVDINRAANYEHVIECLAKPVSRDRLKMCIDHIREELGK